MSDTTIQEGGSALLTAHWGMNQGRSAPSPWVVGAQESYMSHHGKSLGGVNIHVLDGAAKPGPFQKPPTDRVRLAMRETFRAALAAGLSRSEAADLVMSTMLAGIVGAALSDADRARLTMSVQAETRNLIVGIQAGRARRAA